MVKIGSERAHIPLIAQDVNWKSKTHKQSVVLRAALGALAKRCAAHAVTDAVSTVARLCAPERRPMASRQKLKPCGLIGAFDDVDLKVRQDFGRSLLKDRALISAISKELL